MTILRAGLGVGDVLLATGVLEALARVHHKKFVIETRYPELFLHNPHVGAIWPADRRAEMTRKLLDHHFIWRAGSALNAWFDRRAKGWIAVQSSSTYWTPNKNWVPGRMQQVVDALRAEGYEIVHLGLHADEPLNNEPRGRDGRVPLRVR